MIGSRLPPDEIERRRQMSIAEVKRRNNEEWERRHQERCDRLYWTRGQCCAGCDHYTTNGGRSGWCSGNGIVSGADVIKSMGMTFCSYIPGPGFPSTKELSWCGKFRDSFDWSTLDEPYLRRIGAMHYDKLKPKPQHKSPPGRDEA